MKRKKCHQTNINAQHPKSMDYRSITDTCHSISQIAIEDLDDPNRCYIFPCGQWLSSEKDECMTYRELYPVTKRMALMHAKKLQKTKEHGFTQKRKHAMKLIL